MIETQFMFFKTRKKATILLIWHERNADSAVFIFFSWNTRKLQLVQRRLPDNWSTSFFSKKNWNISSNSSRTRAVTRQKMKQKRLSIQILQTFFYLPRRTVTGQSARTAPWQTSSSSSTRNVSPWTQFLAVQFWTTRRISSSQQISEIINRFLSDSLRKYFVNRS